ncbi:unnamed protein product [Penicillium olsonii]|nr:unnamed protein product [Penicillium olsonii]CAG7932838.1 unnamed protein product [Penicillium olsonii]
MSSFFKKPSWAKQIETDTEFYQRSGQTYSDIIAAHREAHHNPKKTQPPKEESTKRRRISEHNEEVEHKPPSPDIGGRMSSPRPSSSPNNSPEPIDHETSQSHSPEITSFVSPAKGITSEAPASQHVPNILPDPIFSRPRLAQPSPPIEDPIVHIVISSEIENTTPLLVQRKMSQSLKEVRLAWCNRQDFAPETHSSIYLTWKGRRLFDVTTCRSLGLHARRPMALLGDDDPLAEQEPFRIHLEAVTDGSLLTNRPSVSGNQPKPAVVAVEDEQGEPIKLILRSPGFEDFKIKARQKTPISRLISAFRDKQNIPRDRSLTLVFDGDKLPPDSCLGDHDIDNLDLVDVQIQRVA